jgi:hypothetical protein
MPKYDIVWRDAKTLRSRSFTCGYCGNPIASEKGYFAYRQGQGNERQDAVVLVCHGCQRPTFIDTDGEQVPGVVFGNDVKDISDADVESLYQEARKATGARCYTLAVLACRKLLMHIAVSKGAEMGKNFVCYVEYLSTNNYVPPDAKDWVDHIRTKGNEANHEITLMGKEDAEELLSFIEMLLKVIFEFPASIKRKYGTT